MSRDPRLAIAGARENPAIHEHTIDDINGLRGALHNRLLKTSQSSSAATLTIGPNTAAHDGAAGRTVPGGVTAVRAYENGWPTKYGNVLRFGGSGKAELFLGWRASPETGEVFYRSRRDISSTGWGGWRQFALDPSTDADANTTAVRDSGGDLHAKRFYGIDLDLTGNVFCNRASLTAVYIGAGGYFNLHNAFKITEGPTDYNINIETVNSHGNLVGDLKWISAQSKWQFKSAPMAGNDTLATVSELLALQSRIASLESIVSGLTEVAIGVPSDATGPYGNPAVTLIDGGTYEQPAGTVVNGGTYSWT